VRGCRWSPAEGYAHGCVRLGCPRRGLEEAQGWGVAEWCWQGVDGYGFLHDAPVVRRSARQVRDFSMPKERWEVTAVEGREEEKEEGLNSIRVSEMIKISIYIGFVIMGCRLGL